MTKLYRCAIQSNKFLVGSSEVNVLSGAYDSSVDTLVMTQLKIEMIALKL